MRTLTRAAALDAARHYLATNWKRAPMLELTVLLSDNIHHEYGPTTLDPAAWDEWDEAVDAALRANDTLGDVSEENAYEAMLALMEQAWRDDEEIKTRRFWEELGPEGRFPFGLEHTPGRP